MGETATFYLMQALNGLSYSMLLFLVAAGLSLIFGLMDVLNLAHGAFYMLGAYIGLALVKSLDSFWLALALAPLLVGGLGYVVETLVLRPMYNRGHLDQVLLTLGLAYIAEDVVHWIWGGEIRAIPTPKVFAHSVSLLGQSFPSYRLFVLVFGLVMALLLWILLERTRLGAIIRAGVSNRQMARNLGININLVFANTFALGCALAALAGVVAGPILGVYLGMDLDVLLLGLIVVVVGGMGSLGGSFFGSLLIGQADTFGKVLIPQFNLFVIFVVMALVLLYRPGGLLGRSQT